MTYYLYVKTHNITGLKYLGQTKNNPFKYKGSGKRWLRHLKVHGYNIKTEILLQTLCYDELVETGLFFSKLFNVVKSNNWANLTEECGNGISSQFSSELQKRRIKEGKMPQVFTKETAITHNKKMLKNGTHPSQNRSIIDKTNKNMIESGTHPFMDEKKMEYNRKVVSKTQKQLSMSGEHNFKNKAPVIDKHGNRSIITKDEYNSQKIGNIEDWQYVLVQSKEARNRRALI
jgi:hypothetical protein